MLDLLAMCLVSTHRLPSLPAHPHHCGLCLTAVPVRTNSSPTTQAVLRVVCQGAQAVGVPGFVSKTYLSFYAVLLCEVLAALPRVTEDALTLLLPFLAAGLKADASKEYTSATLMVLTQLLTRAQLSEDFLKGEQASACCGARRIPFLHRQPLFVSPSMDMD